MRDRITFAQCLRQCQQRDDFMAEFRRLTGSTYGSPDTRPPMHRLVDEATGRTAPGVPPGFDEFVAFVRVVVWNKLPADVREEAPTC